MAELLSLLDQQSRDALAQVRRLMDNDEQTTIAPSEEEN